MGTDKVTPKRLLSRDFVLKSCKHFGEYFGAAHFDLYSYAKPLKGGTIISRSPRLAELSEHWHHLLSRRSSNAFSLRDTFPIYSKLIMKMR